MSVDSPVGDTHLSSEDLFAEFLEPPSIAWPHVWWHWMNGNITKEGIDRDLNWFKRVGIRGFQNFDGSLETPRIVEHPLSYMSPGWRQAFRHAVMKASELGLEFGIASSPGWSETGGPWVRPEKAMKKVVWSQIHISGESGVVHTVPAPPSVVGPYQDIALPPGTLGATLASGHYRDIAVIAHQTPAVWNDDAIPIVSTAGTTSDLNASLPRVGVPFPVALDIADGESGYVTLDYGTARMFRSIVLTRRSQFSLARSLEWLLEVSDDGRVFRRVTRLPADESLQHVTVSFAPITARYVRLSISAKPSNYWFKFAANAPGATAPTELFHSSSKVEIVKLHLHRCLRVHHVEEKAGFATAARYEPLDTCESRPEEVVRLEDIVDLTHLMRENGSLNWEAPSGEWTITRFGYSLTGKTNHPASAEATGLEVDKLDKDAVREYLHKYFEMFTRTVGEEWIGERGIRTLVTDSIEARGQNWTITLPQEFEQRRGYPLRPWLVALTGAVIGDSQKTDRFLWDFRRTLMELMTETHYRTIADFTHERGLTYYSESLEGYPTMAMGDDLDMRSPADIPMGALWTSYRADQQDGVPNHVGDLLGAASVANCHGKPLVGVEALTSGYEPWAFSPRSLRPIMDLAFALGANRPVLHTSVHQPLERPPGLSLGPYGQYFTRHETWAEFARPWIQYLARTSHLLQVGRRVTDVAYFYGEETSLAGLCEHGLPQDVPEAYGFDFVSRSMLLAHLTADGAELVSSGGARYRLLYLGSGCTQITLEVLRKLKALKDGGAQIAGAPPAGSPSLSDDGKDAEYSHLVDDLWGRGRILQGNSPDELLKSIGVRPDFEYSDFGRKSPIKWLHRQNGATHIYFLSNRTGHDTELAINFRVTGKRPELWHADSGVREPAEWRALEEATRVRVQLAARKSLFVVFDVNSHVSAETIALAKEEVLGEVHGPWEVTFEPDRGGPEEPVPMEIGSWSESSDPRIKYFSGIATYRRSLSISPEDLRSGEKILLDLGEVGEVAHVRMNGKELACLWDVPYRCDVSEALRLKGSNDLEIRIANLWVNRLIGDKQRGVTPVASVVTPTYEPTAALRASGLMGPVKLIRYIAPHRHSSGGSAVLEAG